MGRFRAVLVTDADADGQAAGARVVARLDGDGIGSGVDVGPQVVGVDHRPVVHAAQASAIDIQGPPVVSGQVEVEVSDVPVQVQAGAEIDLLVVAVGGRMPDPRADRRLRGCGIRALHHTGRHGEERLRQGRLRSARNILDLPIQRLGFQLGVLGQHAPGRLSAGEPVFVAKSHVSPRLFRLSQRVVERLEPILREPLLRRHRAPRRGDRIRIAGVDPLPAHRRRHLRGHRLRLGRERRVPKPEHERRVGQRRIRKVGLQVAERNLLSFPPVGLGVFDGLYGVGGQNCRQ